MSRSKAYDDFMVGIDRARRLITLEIAIARDPPPQSKRAMVEGLRGGALVLMVAAFEHYLDSLMQEQIAMLQAHPGLLFAKLPEEVRVQNVFQSLRTALDGERYKKAPSKVDRIPAIMIACNDVASEILKPESFSSTGADSAAVIRHFERLSCKNVLKTIGERFASKWKTAVHAQFIPETLDSIVGKRHLVAHTHKALQVSRIDIRGAVRFLGILALCLDIHVRRHIRVVASKAK
jgi:hypothetical protein